MKELKMTVRQMLRSASSSSECLNLVDRLEVLGLEHHFCDEIECTLRKVYQNLEEDDSHGMDGNDLHFACLRFRLLREHGWNLSQGFLDRFKDSDGRLSHDLTEDWKGLLSLYEASYLGTDEETSLKEAKSFATTHLKDMAVKLQSRQTRKMIQYALEKPLHHSLPRFEATRHINEMSQDDQCGDHLHGALIELAKLDFNYTQSLYQEELKEMSKWWRNLGLAKELSLVRDQVLLWYIWPMGMLPEAQFSGTGTRVEVAKVVALIYTVDDVFDVYGSMEDLNLFVEAVERWDLNFVAQLPEYMKACFMAVYNVVKETADRVHRVHAKDVHAQLRKSCKTLCRAYLEEARWCHSRYTPKTDEYMRNKVVSTGLPLVLAHIYYLMGNAPPPAATEGTSVVVDEKQELIWQSSMILRLWDDLGSTTDEKERGYDVTCVECRMKEYGESESFARKEIKKSILQAWGKLNKECLVKDSSNPFPKSFATVALNTARVCKVMYDCESDARLVGLEQLTHKVLVERFEI